MREKIFEARDLEIQFNLRGRVLTAVRRASIELYSNETLAIVGESGSGKSVFTKSFLGMLDKNGYISGGSLLFEGQDLAKLKTEKECCRSAAKKLPWSFRIP